MYKNILFTTGIKMKILNQKEGSKIVLYSFEEDIKGTLVELWANGQTILFSGTKTELEKKGEEFWKPLVEALDTGIDLVYKNYQGKRGHYNAKESGISALESEKEFIIIVHEGIV